MSAFGVSAEALSGAFAGGEGDSNDAGTEGGGADGSTLEEAGDSESRRGTTRRVSERDDAEEEDAQTGGVANTTGLGRSEDANRDGESTVPRKRKRVRDQGSDDADEAPATDTPMPDTDGEAEAVGASDPGTSGTPGMQVSPAEELGASLRAPVKHEVALPPDWDEAAAAEKRAEARRRLAEEPAREYKFVLDPFQSKSIVSLEANESVLVSAHTSAGKTVVAEYAIAMALRDNQRVIYTSPIKALSNQKYRDFYEEFQDVGLMTGDVTINPNASCLVMTTEILRSMLYRGSEVIREVAWVVYDEIHYMRDKERGVVWEETLILLPDTVKFVFLSATIPNAREFAEWICKIHQQPCHVVYTEYRPTPLQHYIFPAGGDGLFLVVDEKGKFREDNFRKSIALLAAEDEGTSSKKKKSKKKSKGKKGGPTDMYKIVKMIMDRGYDPVIVFAFSKKGCEENALQLAKLDFNTQEEKEMIESIFENAIDSLSDDDKELPQISHILPLLLRGIGIHHSGLLPILKEIIEILFQENLIKALFATETFSMGLNMPAKTVVFTTVRKYDGRDFRFVSGGEYIQMSGRAGRRGLDDRGIVIMMVDEKMEPEVARGMVKGQSDPLFSQFHLGYNMLLNVLRMEDANPEHMLRASFHQFQNERAVPLLKERIATLTEEVSQCAVDDAAAVAAYYHLRVRLERVAAEMRAISNKPAYIKPFLQPGRLVRVRDDDHDWGWGVVVNVQKRRFRGERDQDDSVSVGGAGMALVLDVLLHCRKLSKSSSPNPEPAVAGEKGEMMVVPVLPHVLDGVSSIRVYLHKDLNSKTNRDNMLKAVREVQRRFPAGVPLLDPIEDLMIEDAHFRGLVAKAAAIEAKMGEMEVARSEAFAEQMATFERRLALESQIAALKKEIRQSTHMFLQDDLKARKRVLRRLGMTTADNIVDLKGRVACEINAADELLLTHLVFEGVFNDLSVEQCVALLSCFVFQDKSSGDVKLKETLAGPLRALQQAAAWIAKVQVESKCNIEAEEYVQSFKPQLMDAVHAWATGAKFVDVCKMTDVYEGSIIRVFRRLEELIRQMCNAAKAIGSTDLENKFAEGITRIKRDIVFAASLYL